MKRFAAFSMSHFSIRPLLVFLAVAPLLLSAAERLTPEFNWALTGFPKHGLADVAVDKNGQIYVLFNLRSGTMLYGQEFNDGRGNPVVAKLSASGDFLDLIELELPGGSSTIAVDDEGFIVIGGTVTQRGATFEVWGQSYQVWGASFRERPGPDAYVLKLSPSGELVWFEHFGGSTKTGNGETVRDLAVDSDGNIAVVGSWRGSGRFGNGVASAGGESDGFVALFNRDGVHRWIHMIGTRDDGGDESTTGRGDSATTVAMDTDGNVIVGGYFKGVVPVGHHTVSSRPVPKTNPPEYSRDGFVVKIARNGRVLWADAIGGEYSTDGVYDLAVGPNQEVVVTGGFTGALSPEHGGLEAHPNGGTDIFLIKYEPDGRPALSFKVGADKSDGPNSVSMDTKGRIYLFAVTGYLEFDGLFILPAGSRGGAMMCFDGEGRGLWGMGGFFEFFQSIHIPGSSGSQFLVHTSVQPGQAFFEGYSSEFVIEQEGPGAHVLMSFDGAPWDNANALDGMLHPADLNEDWRLDINEVTGYGRAWKTGALWENAPNPIPINYVTRAGAIWKNGESYVWVAEEGEAPRGWVNHSE